MSSSYEVGGGESYRNSGVMRDFDRLDDLPTRAQGISYRVFVSRNSALSACLQSAASVGKERPCYAGFRYNLDNDLELTFEWMRINNNAVT
jgi:hypothetical protein